MMNCARVIVVRHGETAWNREGKRQGHLDSAMTEKGVAQAEALARRIRRQSFDALYSSDLGRARHTAEIIAEATGHAIAFDARLRERGLGVFQGLDGEEIRSRYPEEYRLHRSLGPDYVIPGGESLRQQVARNIACLDEIAQRHPGQTVVVVTHGGVLNGLFRHVFSIPLDQPRRFEFQNAGLNVFTYAKDCWRLQTWGDISHLQSVTTNDGDDP